MGSLIEWMQQQSNQAALLYPHTSKKFGAVAQEMREAQSRIAELEAEVARLRRDKATLHDTLEKVFAEAANQWNDAIEAAAAYCDSETHTPEDVGEPEYYIAVGHEHAAEAIRALRR